MKRRELLGSMGAVAAWPLDGAAQTTGKAVRQIGMLGLATFDAMTVERRYHGFLRGLREAGYVEGQNCVIHYRGADYKAERLPELAAELVALRPEVIFTGTTPAGLAVRRATATIPIVVALMLDPIGDGFVASLARPGGNVTGFTSIGRDLVTKRLGLLRELVPSATRIAALWHRGSTSERTSEHMLDELATVARSLNVQLRSFEVLAPDDLERAFAAMAGQIDAVVVALSHMLYNERVRLADLAARYRVPTTFGVRDFVEAGGLFSYGVDEPDMFRRGASYTARILNGAKPADLPVEQPVAFELVINLRTARALGLIVPPTILALADEVIE